MRWSNFFIFQQEDFLSNAESSSRQAHGGPLVRSADA